MLSPQQAKIRTFEVLPSLPEPLKPLLDLAYNLWWSWHPEATELFVRLDKELWTKSNHNPVLMLGSCPQDRLDQMARDEGFLTTMARVQANLDRHMTRTPWLTRHKYESDFRIAYFCAEFGLTECLQIYSGGLGCLAGDHLKSASELGMPMIAVGLLYRNGYFQQYLNADGWQQEYYPDLDFANLPVKPVRDANGNHLHVSVTMPGREVHIAVWLVQVGRIALYLLDTNLDKNDPADRDITSQLYGGDMETRIKQEIILGIGGVRALEAINIQPDVCHMNEGHSAFLALERIRRLIETHDISFDEARQYAAASHVFTTHTPVPAGIDRFPPDMVQRYFKDYHESLRLDMEGLLALGREDVGNKREFFSMAVLAIRTSEWANGVSKLHGEVSRGMWRGIWPGLPQSEVPITHVTNGVHARSWISPELMGLLDRFLGAQRWQNDPADETVWRSVRELPDEELWRVHENNRHALIVWARRRLRSQLERHGASSKEIQSATDMLDPSALTIGFARRFATYKRANLLLRNQERLHEILANAERPVQFIIAGKSHPADGGGKDLIKNLIHYTRDSEFGHKIAFIENYDINVARKLVQGCDVWLNTPRRGMEASGTSGMKAALNGVLNCSIMDGWWDEAYQSDVGWQIGRGETYANVDTQDDIEANDLYDLLQNRIIPLFYDREGHRYPAQWVNRMKNCIATLAPMFNTNRMVSEYAESLYIPAVRRARFLQKNNLEKSIALAQLKDRLRRAWAKIRIEDVTANTGSPMGVRDSLQVNVTVNLDGLSPADIVTQAYVGPLNNDGSIANGQVTNLRHEQDLGSGKHKYSGQARVDSSGRYGFAVRVLPGGELTGQHMEPGLVKWDIPMTETESVKVEAEAV